MGWHERIVSFRDFAYAVDSARRTRTRTRMASGSVGDVPAATYAELLSGRLMDVYVGAARRHWALHRSLLCHHSELLESELHAHGDGLELPDHHPAGFELLVKWLYQGKLDDVADMADAPQKYDYAVRCHQLYLLCDRFDMAQLKNVAMNQYRKGLHQAELVPDADEIDAIYRRSPPGSPFRRLMTRIAARQIMDPESDRDMDTYRQCFENNADFAVDLVKAIKLGTGGMLFDDPTDATNPCEYHDHVGPHCDTRAKGSQALKAAARPRDPTSASSDPSTASAPRHLPPRRTRPPPILQPPPRHARRQSETTKAGPLRRRLTSPASSTVVTSTEHAAAEPPSPEEQRSKFYRLTPPERPRQNPPLIEETRSHPVPAVRPANSDGESRQLQGSAAASEGDGDDTIKAVEQTSPSRGIWQWARVGTGRLGIVGRIPHPLGMTSNASTSPVNGAPEEETTIAKDDFSVPSSTSTDSHREEREEAVAAAKVEGLGFSSSIVDPLFSQTKRFLDDLVASMNGTPSPQVMMAGQWTNSDDSIISTASHKGSSPATPSPAPRKTNGVEHENTPSPHRIAKYKIALAANILSPSEVAY